MRDTFPARLGDLAVFADAFENDIRAEVRGQDQDGIFEIHRAALAIGDAAVIKNL